MLRHMIVAHSVLHNTQPDLDAHARLNCAYHRSGHRISEFFHSIARYARFPGLGGKGK